MASAPLFQSRDDLLGALRLGGSALKESSIPVVDDGIDAARGEFWARLGGSRVQELLALPVVENPLPTDGNANLRSLAVRTERLLVRYELMLTMPVLVMDAGAAAQESWNDEGAFRAQGGFSRSSDRTALKLKIDENFEVLAGDESPGATTSIQGVTIGPNDEDDPEYLGEKILGRTTGIFP